MGGVICDFGEETAEDENGEHDEGGATEYKGEHGSEGADAKSDVTDLAAFEFDGMITFVFCGVDSGFYGAAGTDTLCDGVSNMEEDGVDDGEPDCEPDGDEPETEDAVCFETFGVEDDEEVDYSVDDDEKIAQKSDDTVFLMVGHFFIPFLFYTFIVCYFFQYVKNNIHIVLYIFH